MQSSAGGKARQEHTVHPVGGNDCRKGCRFSAKGIIQMQIEAAAGNFPCHLVDHDIEKIVFNYAGVSGPDQKPDCVGPLGTERLYAVIQLVGQLKDFAAQFLSYTRSVVQSTRNRSRSHLQPTGNISDVGGSLNHRNCFLNYLRNCLVCFIISCFVAVVKSRS